ncbi:MAG: YdcF family protein [Gammaproteobacteria bacterium]|nr:YdcF family protein [Gammaproteobacteria bacterium]
MNLYLTKILPLFIYPVSLTLLLAGCAGLCQLLRWRRLAGFAYVLAVLVLWVSSTPMVAEFLYGALERQYPPVAIADMPTADTAIVLGGAVGQPLPPRLAPDLNDAIDRVVHTARLYHAGKVPRIIIAAGNLPWGRTLRPEAELIADLLVEWGVPRTDLFLDTQSCNTAENAVNAQAIMAQHHLRTALLVTSAGHMPRALMHFQMVGVAAIPSVTDLRAVGEQQGTIFSWLPDVAALELTTLAIKEWLGKWVSAWIPLPELSPESS